MGIYGEEASKWLMMEYFMQQYNGSMQAFPERLHNTALRLRTTRQQTNDEN